MKTTKNVYQRLVNAKMEVQTKTFRKKDGTQYPYLTIEEMKPAVASAENNAGLARIVTTGEIDEYGKTGMNLTISLDIKLVNIDKPEEYISFSFVGYGKDSYDKAFSKAYTMALKSYFKSIYDIAEEKEDPDGIQEPPKKAPEFSKAKNDSFFSKKTDPPKEQPKATPPPVKATAPATPPTPAPTPAQAHHATPVTPKHDTPFESAISYNRDGGMTVGRAGSAIEELRKAYADPTKKKIIEAEMEGMGAKSFTDLNVTAARMILDRVEAVQ